MNDVIYATCMDAGIEGGLDARVFPPPSDPACAVTDRDGGDSKPSEPLTPFDRPPLCAPAVAALATAGVELVYNGEAPNSFELSATDLYFFRTDSMGMVRTVLSTLRSWTSGDLAPGVEGIVAAAFAIDGCDLYVGNIGGYVSSIRTDGTGHRGIGCCTQTNFVGGQQVLVDATHIYISQSLYLFRVARSGGEVEIIRTRPSGLPGDHGFVVVADSVIWIENGTAGTWDIVEVPKNTALQPHVLATGLGRATTVTSDDTHLYFGTDSNGGALGRVPLAGGTPEPLRTVSRTPISVQVDEDLIYWLQEPDGPNTSGRTLWSALKIPGSPTTQIAVNVVRFRISGSHVYWAHQCDGNYEGAILRAPKHGAQ